MLLDGQLDFGIKAQVADAADGAGALGSTNVFDAGASKKLFGHDEMWLWARFAVTQTTRVVLSLLGDTTAATLATGGAGTEVIASTGDITVDEVGAALVDDGTERFITVRIRIPKQKLAMRWYGLWILGDGGTGETVVLGDAYVSASAPSHLLGAREAAPA